MRLRVFLAALSVSVLACVNAPIHGAISDDANIERCPFALFLPTASFEDNRTEDNNGEKRALYTYKLEEQIDAKQVARLAVTLAVDSTESTEGYFVDLFALEDPQKLKEPKEEIPLGRTAVFKPLAKGGQTTIYTERPPAKAWIRRDGRYEMEIGWRVRSGNASRPVPAVTMRIVKVVTFTKK